MMNPRPPEQRDEMLGFWVGRRRFGLGHIGRGLLFVSMVAGVVGGCFAYGMQLVGKTVVDVDQEQLGIVRDTANAALQQSRVNFVATDSVKRRVTRLEDAVTMLASLKCRELVRDRAPYLPTQCRELMRENP